MALKFGGNFNRVIFNNSNFIVPTTWSINSQRGVMSFEDIPKAQHIPDYGSIPFLYCLGGASYLHKYVDRHHKSLGPIFVAKLKKDIVFISDPESHFKVFNSEGKYPKREGVESWKRYLEETGRRRGLFFMDDEKWIEARRVFNKILLRPDSTSFHVKKVSEVCKNFAEVLKAKLPQTLKQQIYYWNLECVGEIAFGKNLGFVETLKRMDSNLIEVKEKREFVDSLHNVMNESAKLANVQKSLTVLIEEKMEPWPSFCDAMDTMLKYGEHYVSNAISTSNSYHEMYQNDFPSDVEHIRESVVYKALINEKMDLDTLTRVVLDLFVGSPETTCYTALWAIYLLGRNPKVANKAREQIYSVLSKEETFSLSTISKIPYLDGIIKESLRLYSVAPFINRTLPTDVEIRNYLIPAGTTVMSSLLTMGRDHNNYSEPESFSPERWFSTLKNSNEKGYNDKAVINKKAFTPFALGERSCVGKRIAELNLSLLLMELLKNFEWSAQEVDIILKVNTVPDEGFKIDFWSI